jgi:superfamily II DNA or RNA helicase
VILRPYQRRALDDLFAWFGRHPEGNPIVDACVGAGKSVLIATLCREAIEQWPETRIVMTVAPIAHPAGQRRQQQQWRMRPTNTCPKWSA